MARIWHAFVGIAVFGGTGTMLMAQDLTPSLPMGDPTGIVDVAIKSLGPLAILGWYLWYDKSRTQPLRDQKAQEERAAMCTIYEARIDKIVGAFAASIDRQTTIVERMIEQCSQRRAAECAADKG